ncbi:uncharacterized protein JCM15063_002157 [Sporobolomyces koalae]|uniref:uncharacterized protein n=1 Tax=Sporobolomyces koalae TaxID=500713 RepID=UPI0031817DC5
MATLPTLPSVTKLSSYVTRILGQNPGKFTLQGTNTYLVHHPTSPSFILLDTAQSFPAYLPHLRSAIVSHPVQPCRVTDIVLSHWHLDHVDGIKSVIEELDAIGAIPERGVRVWKYPCSNAESDGERDQDAVVESKLRGIGHRVEPLDAGREVAIVPQGRIRALRDGQTLTIQGEETREDVELKVIHTPGHTTDSISILLVETTSGTPRGPSILFSFDTVLGHGTAVFASLSTYLDSLERLIELVSSSSSRASSGTTIYPGHGQVIDDGLSKLQEYRQHRLEREAQVVEALKTESRRVTATELTETIYGDTIPDSLKPAATRGLILHLEKLVLDGKVSRTANEGRDDDELGFESLGIKKEDVPRGWSDRWMWGRSQI